MKTPRSHLILIALIIFLLSCGITIFAARTIQGTAAQNGDCADSCKTKRDRTLERCDGAPEQTREKCREIANTQYDKCVERCGERAR